MNLAKFTIILEKAAYAGAYDATTGETEVPGKKALTERLTRMLGFRPPKRVRKLARKADKAAREEYLERR